MAKKSKTPGDSFMDDFRTPTYDEFQNAVQMLVTSGVTPEIYKEMYEFMDSISGGMLSTMHSELSAPTAKNNDNPFVANPFIPAPAKASAKHTVLPDAAKTTLVLKIKMKGITKPPFWREIVVPANWTFAQLHEAIQAVCGFTDSHLWMFQKKAYDSPYTIAIPAGVDDYTDNAWKTHLTAFLKKKGDKIEYIYDFGDDWVFEVEVKDVKSEKCRQAALNGWSSDLQPEEDSGGPWRYNDFRTIYKLGEKAPEDLLDSFRDYYYDADLDEVFANINELRIDPDFINESLAEI